MFVAIHSVLFLVLLSLLAKANALKNDLYNQVRIDCHIQSIKQFGEFFDFVEALQADLWNESPKAFPAIVTVRAYKTQVKSFQSRFPCPDIASLPVTQQVETKKLFRLLEDFFANYRSFSQQATYLEELIKRHQNNANMAIMGHSIEGRPLYVVHLSNNLTTAATSPHKKTIWVNGGQHAREWLSPAACLYLIHAALEADLEILRHFDLLVAPNLNPDGYEQSRLVNRYWRKNKRVNRDGSVGVDLNRNWDFKWNQINGLSSTHSDVYPGTAPASEPEVLFTANYILSNKHKIVAGIDVHTYGEVVLRNYGWTMTPCKDEVVFKRFGDSMAKAAQSVANEPYRSEPSAGLYPTSGSLDDWFYEQAGFPGFTFEMRDNGRHGFVAPPSHIIPNGQELVAAVKALMKELIGNNNTF